MRFEFEIEIDRPVADVFAYVTDLANLPEWQAGAIEAEWEKEAPSPTAHACASSARSSGRRWRRRSA